MGDIGENEKILIRISKDQPLERLEKDDEVEFEPKLNQTRAIHVKKVS